MSDLAPIAIDERGQPNFGNDSRLWVKFVRRSRRNPHRSEQEGRPIYEPVDYIQIQQPGERDRLDRPVREDDKHRFRRQWEAFQADAEQTPDGTPIVLLFPNEQHITEMLRDLKILTVEQLAQLTEQGITRLGMDGRKYVQRAKAAMDKSENTRLVSSLSHDLADAKDRVKVLEEGNAALQRRLEALEEAARPPPPMAQEPPRRGPGRPRKVQADGEEEGMQFIGVRDSIDNIVPE
jgi:hypothetical protein